MNTRAPFGLKRGVTAYKYGTQYGVQGKSILVSHRTSYGMFREGNKGRKRDGSSSSGEEQAWENRGMRGQKWFVTCKQFAAP